MAYNLPLMSPYCKSRLTLHGNWISFQVSLMSPYCKWRLTLHGNPWHNDLLLCALSQSQFPSILHLTMTARVLIPLNSQHYRSMHPCALLMVVGQFPCLPHCWHCLSCCCPTAAWCTCLKKQFILILQAILILQEIKN